MLKGRINRGFTLIELMIVIAIIGILAGIMVPNFVRARGEANLSGCEQNLKNISTAIEMYLVRNDELPSGDSWDFLTDGKYIKAIPKCPSVGTSTYAFEVSSESKSTYTVYCKGTNHSGVDLDANRPAYVAGRGLVEGN